MATRTAASKTRVARKAAPKAITKAPAKPAAQSNTKSIAKPVAKPVANSAAKPVAHAVKKAKLVRDSFTMPQSDFDLIAALKERALGFKRPTKKSELLRAGLQVLAGLNDASLQASLNALAPLKPGRPKKAG